MEDINKLTEKILKIFPRFFSDFTNWSYENGADAGKDFKNIFNHAKRINSALAKNTPETRNCNLSDVSISLPNGENFKNAMDNLRNEFTKDELADLGNEC